MSEPEYEAPDDQPTRPTNEPRVRGELHGTDSDPHVVPTGSGYCRICGEKIVTMPIRVRNAKG